MAFHPKLGLEGWPFLCSFNPLFAHRWLSSPVWLISECPASPSGSHISKWLWCLPGQKWSTVIQGQNNALILRRSALRITCPVHNASARKPCWFWTARPITQISQAQDYKVLPDCGRERGASFLRPLIPCKQHLNSGIAVQEVILSVLGQVRLASLRNFCFIDLLPIVI